MKMTSRDLKKPLGLISGQRWGLGAALCWRPQPGGERRGISGFGCRMESEGRREGRWLAVGEEAICRCCRPAERNWPASLWTWSEPFLRRCSPRGSGRRGAHWHLLSGGLWPYTPLTRWWTRVAGSREGDLLVWTEFKWLYMSLDQRLLLNTGAKHCLFSSSSSPSFFFFYFISSSSSSSFCFFFFFTFFFFLSSFPILLDPWHCHHQTAVKFYLILVGLNNRLVVKTFMSVTLMWLSFSACGCVRTAHWLCSKISNVRIRIVSIVVAACRVQREWKNTVQILN